MVSEVKILELCHKYNIPLFLEIGVWHAHMLIIIFCMSFEIYKYLSEFCSAFFANVWYIMPLATPMNMIVILSIAHIQDEATKLIKGSWYCYTL